jgi:hypothetical protein
MDNGELPSHASEIDEVRGKSRTSGDEGLCAPDCLTEITSFCACPWRIVAKAVRFAEGCHPTDTNIF